MLALAAAACQTDMRAQRCDPFRTPRLAAGPPVPRSEEKSVHAPFASGDCWACHTPPVPKIGEVPGQVRVIRPVNDHCVSCHREMFGRAPRGHPPEQAFCASCHNPHNSRERSLLLEEDQSRACLDYSPPFREKVAPAARPAAAAAGRTAR
ncbi:MAG TPA: cytochrome c3 family protein [Myxococcales bacterium]|nr:cytochrome c3 family protein [Myxococcales bacterium]